MSKIAFIAPDKELFLQGKKVIDELGLANKVTIHLARLERGVRLAKSLEQQDVDVIVSRGGTARVIIQSRIRIPVVEIPITGQDLAKVFHEAKKITGLARPKVAMVAFDNMVYDIEILSTILGIDLTIYPLKAAADIPARMEEVARTDADIVVGGIKTVISAAKKGFKTHLVRSGASSIRTALLEAQKIALGKKIDDINQIQEWEAKLRNEVVSKRFNAKYQLTDILGVSEQIRESQRISQEIARVDATILISGESGTGKELFAQSIHNLSRRKNGPFVAINCAALPASLLESELFGYVEGAFTGATKKGKPGLFEMAHRGTIFLDEISEMDKYAQSRLLRVLQEKQVMRLGDDKYIPIDVRIIAATNKNLTELVKEGHFRQDLFYRLKVLTLNLPPLRKRIGDIEFLARYFLDLFNQMHDKKLELSPEVYAYLNQYDWPGNVRELMCFIERLVIIANEKRITANILMKYWDDKEYDLSPAGAAGAVFSSPEEERILAALNQCGLNITRAAQLLGIDRGTLYRKLRKYKIEVKKNY